MTANLIEIHVIYASASGNVEWVCEQIQKRLKPKRLNCILHRAEITPVEIVKDNALFIFATSTWDHGIVNPFFNRLLKEIKLLKLAGKKAGFVGLGDSRYSKAHFCAGIDKVRELFIAGGGEMVGIPIKINGEPYEQMKSTQMNLWFEKFVTDITRPL